jgi:histidine triad (HIT) family protein
MARDPACVFCRIVAGELPARVVQEDADVVAFHDVRPQAPVHVPVVPREQGLERGWRLIANTRADGGQEVEHLHLHVVGGRRLGRMLAAPSR